METAVEVKTGLAIEARGLTKTYSEGVEALRGVDLAISSNSTYALLGPNGAGKTTAISILSTLIEPTGGSASILGLDVVRQAAAVRRVIGATFQETVLDEELTGRQVLDYHGRLYRQPKTERQTRIAELLELVELVDAADRPAKTYSGGMKRRLELARGLMTDPSVLFLDEPTLGLDPQNRASIWEHLAHIKEEQDLTLILTTHYMDEAEQVADRVGIIDKGRIVIEGSPRELIGQMGAEVIQIAGSGNLGELAERLRFLNYVQEVSAGDKVLQIGVDSGGRRLGEVIGIAGDVGVQVEDVSVSTPCLSDVFLKYTGRALRDK
jgi:ABC-2 type transport system ATP-binding protein